MVAMRNAAALVLAVSLLASAAQARWVVFGEVLVSQSQPNTVDTPTTYLVIQEQPVDEQPIAILDAWETVDDSMEGFWNTLLLPRRTSVIPNPFSWVYQQLQAVDDFHRAAFSDMVAGGSRGYSSGREAVQTDSPDVASVEEMLRNVGCNRFRPAMQDYEQQQNLFTSEPEVHSDLFLSSLLASRPDDYAEQQDYSAADDYAEDYVGDYDALRSAGDYRSGRATEDDENGDASSSSAVNVPREWFPLSEAEGRLRGGGRSAAQGSAASSSSSASVMGELADSILSMLGGQASSSSSNGRIQETTLGRVANDALQVEYLGAEDDALRHAQRDALIFHQGVENTQVAPIDEYEQESSSSLSASATTSSFSASLSWTREGGLVIEAESHPQTTQSATASDGVAAVATSAHSVQDAAMKLVQYVAHLQDQQQDASAHFDGQQVEGEERMPEYRPDAASSSSRHRRDEQQVVQQLAEVPRHPMLLSDILRREQQQEQQQLQQRRDEMAAVGVVATMPRDVAAASSSAAGSASSSEEQQQGSTSSFAVSWSRDGGLLIETYDASEAPQDAADGGDDAYSSDPYYDGASTTSNAGSAAGDSGPFDGGFEWQPMPAYVVDDDLVWSWTDEEGNLNWGLLVLTLLVVSSAVVAVAAVQSYLALHGAVCAAACAAACRGSAGACGGKRGGRRLSEPLLLVSEDDGEEGAAGGCDRRYVVPPLIVTQHDVAGAKALSAEDERAASYAVEYAALYAQAQGRGRQ